MKEIRSPYIKHLFVCVNRRDPGVTCCSHGGGEAVTEKLKAFVKANGLKGKVRISSSGCMDLCAQGPNVMVEPDHRWYSGVTLEGVDRIIAEHLAPLAHCHPHEGEDPRWSLPSTLIEGEDDTDHPIRAFFFDLGNVLIRFNHMEAARKITASTRISPEEFYQFLLESPLVIAHDEGKVSIREFYEGLKVQMGFSLTFDSFLSVWNEIFEADPGIEALVRRLLRDYPCFLISNTNRSHFEFIRERFRIIDEMSGWALSYEVGRLKPDPAIYRRALELAQVPAAEVFYVDDRSDLIEAGRQLGFQTHRFEGIEPLQAELEKRGIA